MQPAMVNLSTSLTAEEFLITKRKSLSVGLPVKLKFNGTYLQALNQQRFTFSLENVKIRFNYCNL